MSEFKAIDAPLGNNRLADWDALAKVLRDLPKGKAIELRLPETIGRYSIYQALAKKGCRVHVKNLSGGLFAVWEQRNGA